MPPGQGCPKMMRAPKMILCCGEALIDMLPRQTADGEVAFSPHAGGAVFNTAIALGRLGLNAGLFTGLSDDLFGSVLTDALSASNVSSQLAARSDRPTTLAFVKLTNGQAEYAFYDENTAGRMLQEADLPTDLGSVDTLFFGGISLAVEPCAQAYEALCRREAANRVIMIAPNIRPGFIKNAAAYRARIDRMIAVSDIVKLSDEDLVWLRGDGDLAMLARQILDQGAKMVCITEGAQGVTAYTAQQTVRVAAAQVAVVDTVGAGDTFNAGVMASLSHAGLLRKSALADGLSAEAITTALTFGARVAAVTVSRAGANPPWAAELE
ncbi:MAG: fructokinase [Glaciecola sp.]|jgi:fructokinase